MQKLLFQVSLIVATLFFAKALNAQQYPVEGEYQSIAPPATPTLPDLYGTVNDSSVPTTMQLKRITQYTDGWYPHHEYSKIQPWNADATIYKIYSVGLYDAATHDEVGDLPGGELYPTYWSNTHPDTLWGFKENGDIKSYRVSTATVKWHDQILFDENANTEYDLVVLGPGEGNIDKNDKYVAFVGKKGTDMDVIVYDLENFQVLLQQTLTGAWGNGGSAPQYVDWVSVSQSGDYVVIMWNHTETDSDAPFVENGNNHYGVEVYDRATMNYLRRIVDYGNHGDLGYDQSGNEVLVQFWGPTGTMNMYNLADGTRTVLSVREDFNVEGHVSCRNLNRPGWAYVSQDDVDASHTGQIVAFKLDSDTGTEIVEHYGHHFSTASSYLKSPMPVPTPNGDKVMFKSDFGDANTDVIYAFEVTVAAPLAVEWIDPLIATKRDNNVFLKWTVAQQVNNEKFVVEHSVDGYSFEAIETIPGDGDLSSLKAFRAVHQRPSIGDNYYRIKQIDYDGQFDYSNVASIYFEDSAISIYPNPTHDHINIQSDDNIEKVMLFNSLGQLSLSSTNSTNLDISNLPKGIYTILVQSKQEVFQQLIILE